MTVTVRSGSSSSVSVSQGSSSRAAIVVKRADNLNIDNLADVVTADLDSGYTLIYDADLDKWVSQPLGNVTLNAIDGGTY